MIRMSISAHKHREAKEVFVAAGGPARRNARGATSLKLRLTTIGNDELPVARGRTPSQVAGLICVIFDPSIATPAINPFCPNGTA